jgi:hypothetical protein
MARSHACVGLIGVAAMIVVQSGDASAAPAPRTIALPIAERPLRVVVDAGVVVDLGQGSHLWLKGMVPEASDSILLASEGWSGQESRDPLLRLDPVSGGIRQAWAEDAGVVADMERGPDGTVFLLSSTSSPTGASMSS